MKLPDFLVRHRLAAGLAATAGIATSVALAITGTESPAPAYRTEPVTRGDLQITVSATGNVQPTNQVDVGSELSGTVAAVLVDQNDTVKKGQVLARLDTGKLANAVSKAQAALRSAQAHVQQTEATTRETRAQLARLRKVRDLSGGKVPAASELEAAEATLARGQADEAAARAAVDESRAAFDAANTDLAKATIRSPIDGVVLSRAVEPGQTVAASLQSPVLFTLAEDLSRMELLVNIDEADVGRVQAGQKATFTVDAWPSREYPATLTRVSYGSSTTEGVVSYEASLTVDNADLSLRPGMTATASIEAMRREQVLLVPSAALRFAPPATAAKSKGPGIVSRLLPRPPQMVGRRAAGSTGKGSGQQVYLLVDGQPRALPVTVGESNGRLTEIVGEDLPEGAQVIVADNGDAA